MFLIVLRGMFGSLVLIGVLNLIWEPTGELSPGELLYMSASGLLKIVQLVGMMGVVGRSEMARDWTAKSLALTLVFVVIDAVQEMAASYIWHVLFAAWLYQVLNNEYVKDRCRNEATVRELTDVFK